MSSTPASARTSRRSSAKRRGRALPFKWSMRVGPLDNSQTLDDVLHQAIPQYWPPHAQGFLSTSTALPLMLLLDHAGHWWLWVGLVKASDFGGEGASATRSTSTTDPA